MYCMCTATINTSALILVVKHNTHYTIQTKLISVFIIIINTINTCSKSQTRLASYPYISYNIKKLNPVLLTKENKWLDSMQKIGNTLIYFFRTILLTQYHITLFLSNNGK